VYVKERDDKLLHQLGSMFWDKDTSVKFSELVHFDKAIAVYAFNPRTSNGMAELNLSTCGDGGIRILFRGQKDEKHSIVEFNMYPMMVNGNTLAQSDLELLACVIMEFAREDDEG